MSYKIKEKIKKSVKQIYHVPNLRGEGWGHTDFSADPADVGVGVGVGVGMTLSCLHNIL